MYVHTYIHTYVHTYEHTYVHTYIRTYVHTYIHPYVRTYVRVDPVSTQHLWSDQLSCSSQWCHSFATIFRLPRSTSVPGKRSAPQVLVEATTRRPPCGVEECAVSWVRHDHPIYGCLICWCASSVPPVRPHSCLPRLSHLREGWAALSVGCHWAPQTCMSPCTDNH